MVSSDSPLNLPELLVSGCSCGSLSCPELSRSALSLEALEDEVRVVKCDVVRGDEMYCEDVLQSTPLPRWLQPAPEAAEVDADHLGQAHVF